MLPHGSCYTVLSNLTTAHHRYVYMSHDELLLQVRHTDGIGIPRLVKWLFALFSTHPIGDTADSVPSLLFPNTFVPTASDTISSKNLSRIPVGIDEDSFTICFSSSYLYVSASRICSTFSFASSKILSASCLSFAASDRSLKASSAICSWISGLGIGIRIRINWSVVIAG